MFAQLTDAFDGEPYLINVYQIGHMFPDQDKPGRTCIYIVGRNVPIIVSENYDIAVSVVRTSCPMVFPEIPR